MRIAEPYRKYYPLVLWEGDIIKINGMAAPISYYGRVVSIESNIWNSIIVDVFLIDTDGIITTPKDLQILIGQSWATRISDAELLKIQEYVTK